MPSTESIDVPSENVQGISNLPAGPVKDQITPHRLTTVLLIREYCFCKQEMIMSPSIRSQMSLLQLQLLQSPDQPLAVTAERVAALGPAGLVDRWTAGLVSLQQHGVAGIMDLVASVDKLLVSDPTMVSRTSVAGLALRRLYLNFDQLSFSAVSELKERFERYFLPAKSLLDRLSSKTGDMDMSLDSETSKDEYSLSSVMPPEFRDDVNEEDFGTVSRKQADLLIAQQASLLQTSESSALCPAELQDQLARILRSNPGLSEAHYLAFLNWLRVRDVVGATDSLYASFHQVPPESSRGFLEEMNKEFRYAALNLAGLHARLGHKEEATAATREAITMAQEAQDHVCLQHALSWLCRVSPGNNTKLLDKCVARCCELNLSYLASLGIQHLAQHATHPPTVLDHLGRSDVLNCQHSIAELQATSYANKAAAWQKWGRPGLSCTYSQLLLQLNTSDPSRGGRLYLGEPVALALAAVAVRLDSMAYTEAADKMIRLASELFPPPRSEHCSVWQTAQGRIQFQRGLLAGQWSSAEKSLAALRSLAVPDCDLLEAQLLLAQSRPAECRDLLQKLISPSVSPELRAKALMVLADTRCLAGDPAGAVPHLVTVCTICVENRLDLVFSYAFLQLAHCQLLVHCSQPALQCLAPILAHGSLVDTGRVWLLLAKCRAAVASKIKVKSEKRAELLEAARWLAISRDIFQKVGAWSRLKDSLYLLARLYHTLQLEQERNLAAQQYKRTEELYPSRNSVHLSLLI